MPAGPGRWLVKCSSMLCSQWDLWAMPSEYGEWVHLIDDDDAHIDISQGGWVVDQLSTRRSGGGGACDKPIYSGEVCPRRNI